MRHSLPAIISAFALAVAGGASPARADQPSLASVLAQYTNAMGGREALSKIKSTVAVFSFALLGRRMIETTTSKAPFYFLQVMRAEGGAATISDGFDGTTAWVQGADGKVRVLTGEDRAEIVSAAASANASEIFSDRWPTTVALKPSETYDGKTYLVLSIEPRGGLRHDEFLDPQTCRPMIERYVSTSSTSYSVFSEFGTGPLGELQAALITTTRSDGLPPLTSRLQSVKDNVKLSNAMFMPPLGKGGETI